jgi:toxin ParE1/3/4
MAEVVWTEPALAELNKIAEYIALDNYLAAQALVQKVFDSTDKLGLFPELGRTPPELHKSRYRELIVGPCRVFYRNTDDKIFILYVMRSERLLRKYILEERQ